VSQCKHHRFNEFLVVRQESIEQTSKGGRDAFLGLGAETSLTPNRSSSCNTDFTVILEFTKECVTQTRAKSKTHVSTVLQRKIAQQITEHERKERDLLFVTEGLPWRRK
jgi:hypothetical protein